MSYSSLDWSRRDALRVALVGGVSFLLPAIEGRAVEKRGSDRPKSVITLGMGGGREFGQEVGRARHEGFQQGI